MDKKKTLYIGLGIIALCLAAAFVGLLLNRSTSREATAEELARYGAYDPGMDASALLALCTYTQDEQIGRNTYRMYTSEQLGDVLHRCAGIARIAVDGNGDLYIQYTDPEGRNVTLAYAGDALRELAVYDPAGDILFHRLENTVEVWEKFTTGVQWGGAR